MEEPNKKSYALNPWLVAGMGMLGAVAALFDRRREFYPRVVNWSYGAHEFFVGALNAIHSGNFGLAEHALRTSEFCADEALGYLPVHTIRLPQGSVYLDDTLLLRHDEDIARILTWFENEERALELHLATRPGATPCDICGRRVAEPNVRYCSTCWAEACKAVAPPEAIEERLRTLIIEADARRAERKTQNEQAREELAKLGMPDQAEE